MTRSTLVTRLKARLDKGGYCWSRDDVSLFIVSDKCKTRIQPWEDKFTKWDYECLLDDCLWEAGRDERWAALEYEHG